MFRDMGSRFGPGSPQAAHCNTVSPTLNLLHNCACGMAGGPASPCSMRQKLLPPYEETWDTYSHLDFGIAVFETGLTTPNQTDGVRFSETKGAHKLEDGIG